MALSLIARPLKMSVESVGNLLDDLAADLPVAFFPMRRSSIPGCKVILQRLCNHLEQLKPDPQPPKESK